MIGDGDVLKFTRSQLAHIFHAAKLLLIAAAICWTGPATAQPIAGKAKVHDGDTFSFSIRLHGIDAPEKGQQCADASGRCFDCGERASTFLSTLAAKKSMRCLPTGESTHGRPVADCSVDGRDVGETMIRAGWAVPYMKFIQGQQRAAYASAFEEARRARRGIHAGRFVEPDAWRRGQRLACER